MTRASTLLIACLAEASLVGCADELCNDRELETRVGSVCFEDSTEYLDRNVERAPVVLDLDHDGDLDIVFVVANPAPSKLAFLINAGDREFTAIELELSPEDLSAEIAGLALGDFDQDGDPDVAVASENEIWIVENEGIGQFSLRQTIEHAQSALATHDFDGDGLSDLALVGSSLDVATDLVSDAPAVTTFASLVAYPEMYPGGGEGVAVGDISGDGLADLAVTPGLMVFWGTSEGISSDPLVLPLGELAPTDRRPLVLDVDRDGTADVARRNSVFLGQSQAGWMDTRPVQLDPPGDNLGISAVMPAPGGDPSLLLLGTNEGTEDADYCAGIAVLLVEPKAPQPLDNPRYGFINFKRGGPSVSLRNSAYADIDGDGSIDISDGPNVGYGRVCGS